MRSRTPRKRLVGSGPTLVIALLGLLVGTMLGGTSSAVAPSPAAAAPAPGGLAVIVSERGRVSPSFDAEGSQGPNATLRVDKPDGATVRRAILFAATTGFSGALIPGPVLVNGHSIVMGHQTPSGIESNNFWTDVTSTLKGDIDAAPAGTLTLPVVEPSPDTDVDGVLLAVIFNDPNQVADTSVSLLFGALLTGGDHFDLALDRRFNPSDPRSMMQMSLGISYSCQSATFCSTPAQYSEIDVNGRRHTTAAGGEDDGKTANGALITVGGVGDSPTNPPDPLALPNGPRSDDELYDLRPFLERGDQTITVDTRNPSADDNVFFAALTSNPPISDIHTNSFGIALNPAAAVTHAGTKHTVTATITDPPAAQVSGVKVAFNVSAGPNKGVSGVCTANVDCSTDGKGNVSWTYQSGLGLGGDTIEACFVQDEVTRCNTASKQWVNQAPTAADDTARTLENTEVTIPASTLLANDRDRDGDPFSLTAVAPLATTRGVASIQGTDVHFTPETGFFGQTAFSYVIADP